MFVFFGGEVYKNLRICRPRSDFSRSSREIFIRLIDDIVANNVH